MRALPVAVKRQVQDRLWKRADLLHWPSMTVIAKARQYGMWTEDPSIGGVLATYMDPRKVRTYIKDTLMKPYARAWMSDGARILSVLALSAGTAALERYERPHGMLLPGNRILSWGKADDWKLILMATHERAYSIHAVPFAAVLLAPFTRFISHSSRKVVEDAAKKLQIEKLGWLDPRGELEGNGKNAEIAQAS
jgi:hypothetical protein